MCLRDRLIALSTALRRKLLNTNEDLRAERRKKHSDTAKLASLKVSRKTLDKAYSETLVALSSPHEWEWYPVYSRCLKIYKAV